jgi:aspartate 1-decarboxylase
MLIRVCMAKIHRATVTEADLNYVGSITIDEEVLEASGVKPYQMVNVNNLANGVSWQTYAIAGARGSGVICLNGPPARHFQVGDKVIIICEAFIEPSEYKDLMPVVVFVDDRNKITHVEKHSLVPSGVASAS